MACQKRTFSARFSYFLVLVQYFERVYFPFYFKYFDKRFVVLSEKSYFFYLSSLNIFTQKSWGTLKSHTTSGINFGG